MADDRLPCRDNYTDLVTQLQALITALQSTKTVTDIIPITWSDFQNVPIAEKEANCWRVRNHPEPQISPLRVDYGNSNLSNLPSELFKTFEINLQGATITSYWGKISTNIDTSKYKPISILEGSSWEENLNYILENDGTTIHIKSRVENYTISQSRKVYVVCIVL